MMYIYIHTHTHVHTYMLSHTRTHKYRHIDRLGSSVYCRTQLLQDAAIAGRSTRMIQLLRIWISHVTRMKESRYMRMSHHIYRNEAWLPCEWVMSRIWMSHVTRMKETHAKESWHLHRKSSLLKTPSAYSIFFAVSNRGPSVWHGVFCGAPSAAARGCHQVARRIHDPNGIIGARSASPLAPDSVAAIGNECCQSLACSPSHCNHKNTMWSNGFVLDRILGRKRCVFKSAVPESVGMKHGAHMNKSCRACKWVIPHIWMSHGTPYQLVNHIWMSYTTHVNSSGHTNYWVIIHIIESCHAHK